MFGGLVERHTTYEGGRLRYLLGGSGPAMLLCHGFIGSAENFDDWLPEVLPRRTVIIPDLPGFGESTALLGGHTAPTLARAALAAAADANAERFDLAGLCLGGCVALAVQRMRPDAVDRLVLHTPLLAPRLVNTRHHLQVGVMTSRMVWPAIVWLGHRRVVSDLYKRFLVEGSDVDPGAAQANFDNQLRSDPRAAREWLRDGLRRDDLAQVRGSGRPVLVVIAEHDRILNVARVREALDGAPDVSLGVIGEAGHAWSEELSRRQRELIAAFLDGLPLPTAGASAAEAA